MRGPRPFSRDTALDVHELIIARFRAMTPAAKAQLVNALTRDCETLALAGIRIRHPDATADELRLRLGGMRLGRNLMIEAYGWDPAEGRR
jgi:hypothetical protein